MSRYQFYREHKYVSAALNDLERVIAKTDFCNKSEVNLVKNQFNDLADMLRGHAEYENDRLHSLLKKKNSQIFKHVEEDHANQEEHLREISALINEISECDLDNDRIDKGYKLYLTYRKFVADNLSHLHEEETIILPELQRLYSDEELRQVEAETYHSLTPEQIVEMLQVLFPHMNPYDQEAFFLDIKKIVPEKFNDVLKLLNLAIT